MRKKNDKLKMVIDNSKKMNEKIEKKQNIT